MAGRIDALAQLSRLDKPVGTEEVIALLDYWRELAAQGDIHSIAVASINGNSKVAYDYAGAIALENQLLAPLTTLKQELEARVMSRLLGPRDFNKNASYVEWNCIACPVNWDFLIWLVDAEMTRIRLKGPPPLRIHFSRFEELDQQSVDFIDNVFRPTLGLIGAVEDVDAKGGRHKPYYLPQDIVLASRAGEPVPKLRAPMLARAKMEGWLHGTRPVVITLREAPHWQHRNSNLEAWTRFAGDLQGKGHDVIFLRDTYKAAEPIIGSATCPIASWSVPLRMALYELALCNLCISNGPCGLAFFTDTPYLYFLNTRKDELYVPNNPEFWLRAHAMREGEQWPWALPTQRLIWGSDSYANICAAWEEFSPLFINAPREKAVTIAGPVLQQQDVIVVDFSLDNLHAQQNKNELDWLLDKMRGARSLLEIGSCFGQSLVAFAKVMQPGARIRSIDYGKDDIPFWPHAGSILASRIELLRAAGFDADVLWADSTSDQAIAWARAAGPYDMVFIDGDHSYAGVKADWENYGPMGKIVGFHDVNNPVETGARELWTEICKGDHKTGQSVHSTMGIGAVFQGG
jgi:hypothetical protein